MDVKKIIENILAEINKDGKIKEQFEKEPVKVIENIAGVDLPDDVVEKIVDGVKAKVKMEQIGDILDKAEDVAGALKKFF